jgi:hypothetical protein
MRGNARAMWIEAEEIAQQDIARNADHAPERRMREINGTFGKRPEHRGTCQEYQTGEECVDFAGVHGLMPRFSSERGLHETAGCRPHSVKSIGIASVAGSNCGVRWNSSARCMFSLQLQLRPAGRTSM